MFCPRCSQPPVSEEVQFCSGCGFSLTGVRQVLAAGGALPVPVAEEKSGKPSSRRKGIKQVVLLWLVGMLFMMVSLADNSDGAAVFAALFFVAGFVRMLYAFYAWLKRRWKMRSGRTPTPTHLPPTSVPASLFASSASSIDSSQGRATGQIVPPPSVTDHTTRLLDRQ